MPDPNDDIINPPTEPVPPGGADPYPPAEITGEIPENAPVWEGGDPNAVEAAKAAVEPQAAPNPPSTPGLPVAAVAGPARTPPTPTSTPGAPVQSWLVPPTGP